MATIKIQRGSFYMRNYYNNPTPQLTNISYLFICKCMIFYYKSRNVYYYFHFIFDKHSPKYLFEYWGGKTNIIIECIGTKWYIKLTTFSYYRGLKRYRILFSRGWFRRDLRSICQFGGHLNLDAKIQVR